MDSLLCLQISESRMEEIRKIIIDILRQSGAKCGLLIDSSGNLLIRKGFTLIREIDNLCALISASRATTQAISAILGQKISMIFHQGAGDHIHNTDVGDLAILTLIFDDRASLSQIRDVTLEYAPKLRDLLEDCDLDPDHVRGGIEKLQARADKMLEGVFDEGEAKAGEPTPEAEAASESEAA